MNKGYLEKVRFAVNELVQVGQNLPSTDYDGFIVHCQVSYLKGLIDAMEPTE